MPANSEVWRSAAWLTTATDFADKVLAGRRLQRVGPVELARVQPWSVTARVPYAGAETGVAWLKTNTAANCFEPALITQLADVDPSIVAAHWGYDDNGLFVSPDYGPVLRDVVTDQSFPEHWSRVLARYARLQIRVAQSGTELVCPTYRPEAAAAEFASRANDPIALEVITAAGQRLAQGPVPLSIQHDDLHPWNVFLPADQPGAAFRVFDWGDSYVGHPFASLQVALDQFDDDLSLPVAPVHRPLLDAYLEPWRAYAADEVLVALVVDALVVAPVSRILSWERALQSLTEQEAGQWSGRPGQWLDIAIERAHAVAQGH